MILYIISLAGEFIDLKFTENHRKVLQKMREQAGHQSW